MGRQRRQPAGRLSLVAAGALALGGLAGVACQPTAPPPPPPPPPPPASCDAASQATPTPEHPLSYAAIVQPDGSTPEATSFTATSDAQKQAEIAQLERSGAVLAVGPNQVVTAQTDPVVQPADYPLFPQQWGLQAPPGADFPPAWNLGYSGGGQTIAIVDTGVDLTHQGLAGRVTAGPDFVAGGLVTGDPNGHGTHVAGIAADADTSGGLGGAPNAQLLAVRVLDASGSGTDVQVASGILWAASHGATVINLSLGAAGCDAVLQSAVQTAASEGVVVVAAAGNDGSTELFSPAAYSDEVIAVAATDQTGAKASFSNDGGFVALAAPGVDVLSTCTWTPACIDQPGDTPSDVAYGDLSGTSMATPFVSAAAALVKEECPSFSPSQVRAELVDHAGAAVPGFAFHELDAGAAVAADCT